MNEIDYCYTCGLPLTFSKRPTGREVVTATIMLGATPTKQYLQYKLRKYIAKNLKELLK